MRSRAPIALASVVVISMLCGAPQAGGGEVIVGTPGTGQLQLPEGVPEIDLAIARFKKGEYEPCLNLLKSAAARDPDLFPARLMFAKLCLVLDRPAMGRAAMEQAAVERPELPEVYLVFGRLALQDSRLTDAQLHFDKALALTASGTWAERLKHDFLVGARAGMAALAEQRKDWPAAATNLAEWLVLEPKNGQARQRMAAALFRQGRRDKSLAELEHAVKDDLTLEPAAVFMGRLFHEAGDPTKAAEWMKYATAIAPDDPRVHLAYARWLLEQNEPDRAKTEIEAAARLDHLSSEIKTLRGLIAWHLKDYQAAEEIFQALHLESPTSPVVNNLWALSLAEQPDAAKHQRASRVVQFNAQLHPNSADALTTLGRVAHRLGQLDQAEQSLRTALASGNGSSETAYFLARVLADLKKEDEIPRLLKLSLDAPGRFAFRAEAQEWLDRLGKTSQANPARLGSN